MFPRSNLNITGGTFIQINQTSSGNGGFELLKNAASPAAFHDSADRRDPPKCHPNTRVAIVEKLKGWVHGLNPETLNALIVWLYGPAGSGKSAIAQTIAELCAEEGTLLASFFFFRSDPTRNHSGSLIPTIAYQIATHFPSFRERISAIIKTDPHIFNRSLTKQITSLIIEPFLAHGAFDVPNSKSLIIIDGLDECEDREGQIDILHTISSSFQQCHLPLTFLIASRPEYDITNAFGAGHLQQITSRLALDDGYQASDDIRLFLKDQLAHVKQTHPLKAQIADDWPAEEVLNQVVNKSSGQFIYAATVAKFVKSTRHRPQNRLEIVLGLHPAGSLRDMPFSELDELYHHIFRSVLNLDAVLRVLSWHVLKTLGFSDFSHPWHVREVEDILSFDKGEIHLLFCDLHSIVDIQREFGREGTEFLRIIHASLEDFLLDESRSKELYIDAPTGYAECSRTILQYFPRIPTGCISLFQLMCALGTCMELARPTAELRQELSNFNITQYFQASFGHEIFWYVPKIFDLFKYSKFTDADDIFSYHTRMFEEYAIAQLKTYYSEPRLLTLIAIIVCRPNELHSWMHSQRIHRLLQINQRLSHIDQHGLGCLLIESSTASIGPASYFKFLASFLNDGTRAGAYVLDGQKYASAALYVLQYTRVLSGKQHQLVKVAIHRHVPAFKILPWKWHRGKLWTREVFKRWAKQQMRHKRRSMFGTRGQFYADVCNSSKLHNNWVWSLRKSAYGEALGFGLECLLPLLSRAEKSEELIQFSQRCSFGTLSVVFPKETKAARQAISLYLKRMGADEA